MEHRRPHTEFYNVPATTDEFNGMPYRLIGKSGLRASAVGLGTWKMGYPETGDGSRVNEKASLEILDRAVELGVTFWDTANRYNAASGNSERIIGTWMDKNREQRRNIVIATKVFGGMDGVTPNHSRLSRGNILDSTYACLERLKLDYIDVLYFHRFEGDTPAEESLMAIEDLVRQDIIRYFAVSNFTVEQLKLYQDVEKSISARCRVIAVQNKFDILTGENKDYEGMLDYCAEAGVSLIAYSPLARGLLTDRYLDISNVGPGDRLYDEGSLNKFTDNKAVMTRLQELASLSKSWGYELSQLSLAYMLTLPGMGSVIPSSSSVNQLESNAQAGKIQLTDSQIQEIRKILSK